MSSKVRLNSRIRITFRIQNSTKKPVNVNLLSGMSIVFKKPDDSILEVLPKITTDGLDGLIYYDTVLTDLDQLGTWQVQLITLTDPGYSDVIRFRVCENLKPPTN